MSKAKSDSTQFELPFDVGLGTIGERLAIAAGDLAAAIRKSPLSREQVIDDLALLLGRQVSRAQFDAWTAESNRNRMPADVLVGLSFIVGARALDILLEPLGLRTADRRDQAYADLGRKGLEAEDLHAEISKLKTYLRGGR